MKKVTRIFCAICMMGLLTFVSTSCKKNQENGEMTINVSMPALEDVGDRAYIHVDGQFWWHENDFIRVFNLADEANSGDSKTAVYYKVGNASVQKARFRGPSLGVKKAEGFRIFYPVDMVKGETEDIDLLLHNENRVEFTVSDHQEFHSYAIDGVHHYSMVDPAAMPMAERMEKITDNATLHHMFGVAAFNINAGLNDNVVVDSVKYEDNGFNITGKVSVKLHKVAVDDTQGEEHNLNRVWDAYNGMTPEFLAVLAPELEWLDWDPDYSTVGTSITMDCVYEHADGTVAGETLGVAPAGTNFNFMLRPLAVSQGFTLTVYIHDAEPIVLTQDDFEYGIGACDYTWATKPGKRKTYIKSFPII